MRLLLLAPVNGKIKVRVLTDRTSTEVFANGGDVTFSGVFFPDSANHDLLLGAQGGTAHLASLAVGELKSIWPAKEGLPSR